MEAVHERVPRTVFNDALEPKLLSTLVLLAKDPERRIREVEEAFLRKAG